MASLLTVPRTRSRRRSSAQRPRSFILVLALAATAGLSFVTSQAFTAANTVPATNISQFTQAITPFKLEPPECRASITATSIVAGTGTINSTAANQLVLGSSSLDTLSDPNSGTDCMVGGAGADKFTGQSGNGDLCIVSTAHGTISGCTIVATRP